jgi:hypothetical protein
MVRSGGQGLKMPAVWITLDYVDGRSKIRGPLYPDEIDLTGLLFRFERARPSDGYIHPC